MRSFLIRLALSLVIIMTGLTVTAELVGTRLPPVPQLAFLGFHQFRFYSQYKVYVMDVPRALPARLNLTAVDNCCLKLAPDGLQVAFQPSAGSNLEIDLLDINSGKMQSLQERYGFEQWVSWSPDGNRVVFTQSVDFDSDELWMMNADGSNRQRLTFNNNRSWEPAWSPDGTQIAFMSNYAFDPQSSQQFDIYVIDVDCADQQNCEHQRRLTNGSDHDFTPEWSPDSRTIVFASDNMGSPDIYTIDLETGAIHQLTDHPAADSNPVWSPDGSEIAFISNRDDQTEIYLIKPDGSDLRRLTYSQRYEGLPIWLPDSFMED